MSQVAIYCRLSIEDKNKLREDDSQSIQNQKLMLIQYCKEHNWDIYDVYCDDGYSGIDKTRPDFNRMLADCKSGKIDIVLCKDQSRFSRDTIIVEQYINDKFLEWDVRFIGVSDNADSNSESYAAMRLFASAYNEMYVKDISGKIRNTLKVKREQGQFIGAFAPYGYAIDPKDKHHLIIDNTAALIVKQIFEFYIQGWGYRKIAIYLNEQKIPSPAKYKRINNSRFVSKNEENSPCSGLWTMSTVAAILKNEMYIGTLVQGKTRRISYKNKKKKNIPPDQWVRIPNAHEAIIFAEIWEKVQERISSNKRVSKIDQTLSPLAEKVRCATCGKPMKRNVYYNKDRTMKYYSLQCASYKTGAMNCTNVRTVSGLKLEKTILDALNQLVKEYCQIDDIILTDIYQVQITDMQNTLKDLQRDFKTSENRLTNLYKDKLDGVISLEEYQMYGNKFRMELNDIELKCNELTDKIKLCSERQANDAEKKALIQKYSHFTELTWTIVDEFIDSIFIGEFDKNDEREIFINWKI